MENTTGCLTNKEKFMDVNVHRGLDAPHAVYKALLDAGATTDEIWELTEPYRQNLIKRMVEMLRAQKPYASPQLENREAVQPV